VESKIGGLQIVARNDLDETEESKPNSS